MPIIRYKPFLYAIERKRDKMKFYAELFLKDEKTAANLVRSMLKDIDPESSIHIKGMNCF